VSKLSYGSLQNSITAPKLIIKWFYFFLKYINNFLAFYFYYINVAQMKIKARAWLRRFTIVLVLLLGAINLTSLLVGIGFILLGMLVHIWAIGCLIRNARLTVWGPYRFVRHPFYLANFFIDIGICSAGVNPYIFAVYLILFYFIYYLRMKKEEKHLTELFPADYPKYVKLVPRFIPLFFKRYPKTSEGFSWAVLIAAGNEITRILRLLIYPLVLYFQMRRFPLGAIKLYDQNIKYGLSGDIIPGVINYQEIIIIGVILALSVISIIVKSKAKEKNNSDN
jgi:protein-S-isoprenylcysteine O-methyltransferase Ste14